MVDAWMVKGGRHLETGDTSHISAHLFLQSPTHTSHTEGDQQVFLTN